MKAIISNKLIIVKNPSEQLREKLSKVLSYRDKSKVFQLNKLKRNPFYNNKGFIKKLEKEASGTLLKIIDDEHIAMSSGFSYLLPSNIEIEDKRELTGEAVSLPWKKKPFDMRPYQEEAVNLMESNYRGIINFATGLGKSLVALYAIKKHRTNTLIVVPNEGIANQFYEALVEAFGESKVGFYSGRKKKIRAITVGIAASVNNHIDKFQQEPLGMVLVDEVHHIAASTFFNIALGLSSVGKVFGLTATDYRSDGKDVMINGGCGDVIIKRDIKWGIDNNFLAKPTFISKVVPTTGYDYNDKLKAYKAHVLNDTVMREQIKSDIQHYLSKGKKVLCLVAEVAHGEQLSKELGLPFAQGKDKLSVEYVNQLNRGDIDGLIGTGGKISEGVDTKVADVLILANFMASKGPVVQSVGRVLRITDTKKEALIVDYQPSGSSMLTRHAEGRVKYYKEITSDVTVEEL